MFLNKSVFWNPAKVNIQVFLLQYNLVNILKIMGWSVFRIQVLEDKTRKVFPSQYFPEPEIMLEP